MIIKNLGTLYIHNTIFQRHNYSISLSTQLLHLKGAFLPKWQLHEFHG